MDLFFDQFTFSGDTYLTDDGRQRVTPQVAVAA